MSNKQVILNLLSWTEIILYGESFKKVDQILQAKLISWNALQSEINPLRHKQSIQAA